MTHRIRITIAVCRLPLLVLALIHMGGAAWGFSNKPPENLSVLSWDAAAASAQTDFDRLKQQMLAAWHQSQSDSPAHVTARPANRGGVPVNSPRQSALIPRRDLKRGDRAKGYWALILYHAARFGLDPALVAAVIHTESGFDPRARSNKGALGLMQIVPRHGGYEAYEYLYGRSWDIPATYLYSPQVNIELGAAYLHLLKTKYFGHIKDPRIQRYLVICAYNWGPGAVISRILDRYAVTRMSPRQVYTLLTNRAPEETRQYLRLVVRRIRLYA